MTGFGPRAARGGLVMLCWRASESDLGAIGWNGTTACALLVQLERLGLLDLERVSSLAAAEPHWRDL